MTVMADAVVCCLLLMMMLLVLLLYVAGVVVNGVADIVVIFCGYVVKQKLRID